MNSFLLSSYLASIFGFSALLFGSTSGHVFVKNWKTSSDSKWQPGQKAWQLKDSAYRRASDSIGWVGSNFLTTNKAIVCGASYTPKGQVAPSTGKFFSDASESAGQTLKVRAGGTVTLALQGDSGQGWVETNLSCSLRSYETSVLIGFPFQSYPHYHGHLFTYLARCGSSATACQSFDASTASYFKIQEKRDGVDQLRKQYSSEASADVWEVPIPKGIPTGSYIFRFEMWALLQFLRCF
jgi:hypothetical protein